MSKLEEFLKLVSENPELPVLPLVDCEVVGNDDYHWWLGDWGSSEIVEYYYGRECIHLKGDEDVETVLSDLNGCEPYKDFNNRYIDELSSEELDELYGSLPWEKAIIVHIIDNAID